MKTLQQIADDVHGHIIGDADLPISGVAGIQEAEPGQITFLAHRTLARNLHECRASAIIIGKDLTAEMEVLKNSIRNIIVVDNPMVAYAKVTEMFDSPKHKEPGISHLACVSENASVSPDAAIMPFVYVGSGSNIDRGVTVYPFAYIGENVRIGEDTLIYSNASLYSGVTIGKRVIIHAGCVLGSDGFGYTWDGMKHRKIRQLGTLVVEDDVEVGANTTIDRGSLGRTVIGRGVKIDNLVQIAHNVSIGENSIIVAQVGIAGSSTLGKNVVLAGQVGVKDHVSIGDNVKAGGSTGITKDVTPNSNIMGTPHMPHREWLRLQHYLKRLPELFRKIDSDSPPLPGARNNKPDRNPSGQHGSREGEAPTASPVEGERQAPSTEALEKKIAQEEHQ